MSGTPRKRAASTKPVAPVAKKPARGRATAKKSTNAAPAPTRRGAGQAAKKGAPGDPPNTAASAQADRSEPEKLGGDGGEGAPADLGSTSAAVERALAGVKLSRRSAVLVQSVRRLADGLDRADPTDMAKLSKELNARWAELLAEVKPSEPEPDDWTRPAPDPAPVRDAAKPGAADKGRGGRRRR